MLKIGILGGGNFGEIHIDSIRKIAEYQLVGFFDPNPELSLLVSEQFSLKAYDSMESLIEDCDVVDFVCSKDTLFEDVALALRKFRHVFISKQLINNPDEAQKLAQIAQEANMKVQVSHADWYNPAFVDARNILDKPMFIETYRQSHIESENHTNSVVFELMIQDIDLVLKVVNSNIRRISANGTGMLSDKADIVNARIEFDNGCVANLTVNRLATTDICKARFYQKSAFVSVDFLNKEYEVIKAEEISSESSFNDYGKILHFKPIVTEFDSIEMELRSFLHAIQQNEIPKHNLNEAFKSLEVAIEIIEKSGNIFNLPY